MKKVNNNIKLLWTFMFLIYILLFSRFYILENKSSDRIGCSDIQKIFIEKQIDCEKIQLRFK